MEYFLRGSCIKVGEDMMVVRNVEKKCKDLENKNIRVVVVIERIKKSNVFFVKRLKKIEKVFRKVKGSFF